LRCLGKHAFAMAQGLPMLHCWRILVPLNMVVGFKDALTSLERLVAASEEQIRWLPATGIDVLSDVHGDNRHGQHARCFDPFLGVWEKTFEFCNR
jgi:hypothetical protein